MKRIIACLLALVLLATIAPPAFGASARDGEGLAKIEKLTVSTGGKAKQLVLRWTPVPGAEAYQVLRSTTGKTGSYKIVCARSDTAYTDTGLKHSTTYYYAVRPLALRGGKTVCGPCKKANLSTRIAKSYASYRFEKTWKAMDIFVSAYDQTAFDRGEAIEKIRGDWYGYYFPFRLKGCSTKADAVKYLAKYFTKTGAKNLANFFLKTIRGKLYIWLPQDPGVIGTLIINDIPTLKISYGDKRVVCKFGTWYIPAYGMEGDPLEYLELKLKMQYEGGRWVFSDDGWYNFGFPYTTMITPNDGP